MGITLITPTGDRHAAFFLCEFWMSRQTYQGDIQWIVVDDGHVSTECNWSQEYHRLSSVDYNSLCRNMREALNHIKYDKILIIEDDDYYAPNYIDTMNKWLDRGDLVGESGAKYYYLPYRRYFHKIKTQNCSWARTGFRDSLIPFISEQAASDHPLLDMRVWRNFGGRKYLREEDLLIYTGIKGVPGRQGVVWKPRGNSREDSDLSMFNRWLGEDSNYYLGWLGTAKVKLRGRRYSSNRKRTSNQKVFIRKR